MRKIVIIDDEAIVIKGIQAMIARENTDFQVVDSAMDGIDGLAKILKHRPELVISDIRMPGMDGLSLIETAREECPDTVFFVISGFQEFEYARRALSLGVRGYIDKPVTISKIRETLKMTEEILKESEQIQDRQKRAYQEAYTRLNDLIYQNQYKGYEEVLNEVLMKLKKYVSSLEEYKEESYKLICMSFGIFYEQRKEKKEEQHFPSYQNIETLSDEQEVDAVTVELFKNMFRKFHEESLGGMHRTIKQLLEYIDGHYAQDIGLVELADQVEMNPAYLSILFKEEVGISYIKYLTRVRMDAAKELLKEGRKVVDVSEMVGYSNYRYFCDIFKKQVGITPSEYKGNVRGRG